MEHQEVEFQEERMRRITCIVSGGPCQGKLDGPPIWTVAYLDNARTSKLEDAVGTHALHRLL